MFREERGLLDPSRRDPNERYSSLGDKLVEMGRYGQKTGENERRRHLDLRVDSGGLSSLVVHTCIGYSIFIYACRQLRGVMEGAPAEGLKTKS